MMWIEYSGVEERKWYTTCIGVVVNRLSWQVAFPSYMKGNGVVVCTLYMPELCAESH